MYEYKVEGFLFESQTQSEEAEKEVIKVERIKNNVNFNNIKVVLQLYDGLIAKNVFHTPIGIGFLYELRLRLLASPEIKGEEIQPIPVPRSRTNRKMQPPILMKDYRKSFYISTALAVVFGISIIGIFIIMRISDNNVTILNYRNAIINEYAEWEKELQERESRLDNYIQQEP